ncbi:MAG: hypothetical protein AMXMBFR33_36970 [Candidatus Xenobia bacterium]
MLDVRESEEIASQGTLPGALHIPFGQLEARLHELPTDSKAFGLALKHYQGARVFPGLS